MRGSLLPKQESNYQRTETIRGISNFLSDGDGETIKVPSCHFYRLINQDIIRMKKLFPYNILGPISLHLCQLVTPRNLSTQRFPFSPKTARIFLPSLYNNRIYAPYYWNSSKKALGFYLLSSS